MPSEDTETRRGRPASRVMTEAEIRGARLQARDAEDARTPPEARKKAGHRLSLRSSSRNDLVNTLISDFQSPEPWGDLSLLFQVTQFAVIGHESLEN